MSKKSKSMQILQNFMTTMIQIRIQTLAMLVLAKIDDRQELEVQKEPF